METADLEVHLIVHPTAGDHGLQRMVAPTDMFGCRVSEGIAVMGFDDTPEARIVYFTSTTISQAS